MNNKEVVEEAKKQLPEFVLIDGKGYFLAGNVVVGGNYRLYYVEFDNVLGGARESGSAIIDWMADDINKCIEVVKEKLSKYSYEVLDKLETKEEQFYRELCSLLNRYSKENGSDTPDFVLASYLLGCLRVFDSAVRGREEYYGRGLKQISKEVLK